MPPSSRHRKLPFTAVGLIVLRLKRVEILRARQSLPLAMDVFQIYAIAKATNRIECAW